MQLKSEAWRRRYDLFKCGYNGFDCFDFHTGGPIQKAFEHLARFNVWQLKAVSAFMHTLMFDCWTITFQRHRSDMVVMDDVWYAAQHHLNVQFSAPLESRYRLGANLFTLRDLACLGKDLTKLRSYIHKSGYTTSEDTGEACKRVNNLDHEDLLKDVRKLLVRHRAWFAKNAVDEELLGGGPDADNANDDDWEDWVIRNWDEKYDWDSGQEERLKSQLSVIDDFIQNFSPENYPPEATPPVLTNREAFQKFVCSMNNGCRFGFEITASALDLLQMITEDFVLGVAVKPFLMQREDRVPTQCHLIIGKNHGTTIATFIPIQFGLEAVEGDEDDGDSAYSPSEENEGTIREGNCSEDEV